MNEIKYKIYLSDINLVNMILWSLDNNFIKKFTIIDLHEKNN